MNILAVAKTWMPTPLPKTDAKFLRHEISRDGIFLPWGLSTTLSFLVLTTRSSSLTLRLYISPWKNCVDRLLSDRLQSATLLLLLHTALVDVIRPASSAAKNTSAKT